MGSTEPDEEHGKACRDGSCDVYPKIFMVSVGSKDTKCRKVADQNKEYTQVS